MVFSGDCDLVTPYAMAKCLVSLVPNAVLLIRPTCSVVRLLWKVIDLAAAAEGALSAILPLRRCLSSA